MPLKHTLENQYFGNNMDGMCQCCFTTPIHSTNFDCGHIVSEKNGGDVHLKNLKPICRTCNSSMGTKNMNDYIKKYGFDKIDVMEQTNLKQNMICGKKIIFDSSLIYMICVLHLFYY